jgi:hypothetical protein
MAQPDINVLRAATRFAKMDADKQMLAAGGGGGGAGLDSAGPPTWSRAAWDSFHAQYGRWPFSATELPPSFDGCPAWAYQLMGLRQPPVQVVGGSASTGAPQQIDALPIFRGSQ